MCIRYFVFSFWLEEMFPRIIDRTPEDPYKFTCNDIRNLAIERGLDHNNTQFNI